MRREVSGDRHGVDMPSQHHPFRASQAGPGDHRVAVTVHGEVRQGRTAPAMASASGSSSPLTEATSNQAGR